MNQTNQAATETPRPWKVIPRGSNDGEFQIVDAKGFFVAMVNRHQKSKPVLITNTESAALIVEAVNSYEALLAALKQCEHVIGMAQLQGKLSDNPLSPEWDALRAARACLDSARKGETK